LNMPLNNVDVFRAIADQEIIHIKRAFAYTGIGTVETGGALDWNYSAQQTRLA